AAAVRLVAEELVTDQLLLVVDVLLDAVAQHHVVEALVRGPRHLRAAPHQGEVVLEAALPRQLLVGGVVLQLGDLSDQAHGIDGSTSKKEELYDRRTIPGLCLGAFLVENTAEQE